ncbi:hypothetical protein EX895_006150 [Sporisorium graminicola]|uniref:Prefoldin subunit 5 n=1 Tax=Sporisorium graminicola TaxID=280036 RepID=A0A4U7KLI1_9BASI|nr:hypothetical protein EX895_006150 [Sporisorium graminicola]TKY85070.1 hypothetical protein EX895_006150 [Sporisorium graminicola]
MGSKGQQVDLMSLDVQQLLEVKKQLETEVQHLTSSFGQLKAAQAKFKSCIDSVATIKPENKDKTTLIPLTSSLYVPGKLSDLDNVIVDVGTGYFVEKSTSDATKMYQEKVEFLTKNLEQLQETVLRQQENLQTTVEMIRLGIESVLHDPPFPNAAHAKTKRLRPVSAPTLDSRATDILAYRSQSNPKPPLSDADAYSHRDNVLKDSHSQWSRTHPPDRTLSTPSSAIQSCSRFQPTLPVQLLLDFLTGSVACDKEKYRQTKAQLPPGFHRIDAYLMLRELDPQSLSALSHFDIFSLIKRAGKDGLGGVLALLLEDIIGTDMTNTKAKPGYFHIYPGTEERYNLLRAILVRCNSGEFMLHNAAILNVFMLMLDDLIRVRPSSKASTPPKGDDDTTPSTLMSSSAHGASVRIPTNFPVGETMRLLELAMHLHNFELAPIINALRAHLEAHTPDFPSARQGAQLIAYYLQPNLRDFAAALDVVRALRDTNALPQQAVEDAVRDGKTYLAALEAFFSSAANEGQPRPSEAELQQICMDVSLRLIAMKCVMAHRPKGGVQYRKAFESLTASFRLDMLDADDRRNSAELRSLLNVPFRCTRNVFTHLVGQNDKSCLIEALYSLQRSDQRLLAMLPNRDLQDFCDAARTVDALHLAAEAYTLFVKAKTSAGLTRCLPTASKHVLARDGLMTDTDTFLAILGQLLSRGQRITVTALLRALRLLPLTDAVTGQLNLRFGERQRSRLVALLAEAALTEEAFELFQLWSHRRYEAKSNESSRLGSTLRRIGSVRIVDPLIERQVRLMHDSDRQFAISTEYLGPLVKNLCHHPSVSRRSDALKVSRDVGPSLEHLDKARFVIDVFRQACTPIDWTHYRLTSLAGACFTAKDVAGAFDALAKIVLLRRIPDQVDIYVLLGGLVEINADKAVNLFIQHCSAAASAGKRGRARTAGRIEEADAGLERLPKLAPMEPTPALITMLITRVLAQERLDLTEKLFRFSRAVGLDSRLRHVASMRAVFSPEVSPFKVTQTIHRMLQNGWTADPVFLEKLAQSLLERSMQAVQVPASDLAADGARQEEVQNAGKKPLPRKRLQLVQAATRLMKVSARSEDVVNLRTTLQALSAICSAGNLFDRQASLPTGTMTGESHPAAVRTARQRSQEERRSQWIACVDSIVYSLRWTRFFDKGDDYRQNLPLWKAGNARNGELVSVDLNEMLDYGFVGCQRQQARAHTSAAAAATLPTSSEASVESPTGIEGGADDAAAAPADGVVRNLMQRPPNVLPSFLFCRLIETYLALGDVSGAAEVASWMRDEAKLNLGLKGQGGKDFVSRIKAAVQARQAKRTPPSLQAATDFSPTSKDEEGSSILRMLAGQQSTARTKSWWSP